METRRLRLAYADPPYPGCAHLYPEKTEVDHVALIGQLCEYDGWALSTNENALQDLLALSPSGVRVLAWCKSNASPFHGHPTPSWEPVLLVPARNVKPLIPVRSYYVSEAPTGFRRRSDLPGQKPEGFCEWVIRCLGADPEDTFDDLFPGTGIMGEAWERWRMSPELFRPTAAVSNRTAARLVAKDSMELAS